jgi:GrpB-like predicted nucleotidyltransferase (UPF0157 family)
MNTDKQVIRNLLEVLCTNYRIKLEKPLVEAWIIGLDGLSRESIMNGKVEILQNRANPFMPSTGEFRAVCKEIERKQRIEAREQQKLIDFNNERDNGGERISFNEWLRRNPDRDARIQRVKPEEAQASESDHNGGAEQ